MFVLYFRGVSKAQYCDTIPEGAEKQKFSTTTINDRQLSNPKICLKISVIKTNSFDWELLTFDDNKKNSSFWHFNSHFVLKTSVCKGGFVFVMITEIF